MEKMELERMFEAGYHAGYAEALLWGLDEVGDRRREAALEHVRQVEYRLTELECLGVELPPRVLQLLEEVREIERRSRPKPSKIPRDLLEKIARITE